MKTIIILILIAAFILGSGLFLFWPIEDPVFEKISPSQEGVYDGCNWCYETETGEKACTLRLCPKTNNFELLNEYLKGKL